MNPCPISIPYKRHRFPVEIISHCVWLYCRFYPSYRDVVELIAARDVILSYEAMRYWCRQFGQAYANQLRRRRPDPGTSGTWTKCSSRSMVSGRCHQVVLIESWPILRKCQPEGPALLTAFQRNPGYVIKPPPRWNQAATCRPRVCVATPLETDTARHRSLGPRAYARRGAPGRHHQSRVRRATLPHVPAIR
jgi:hypothetical protein